MNLMKKLKNLKTLYNQNIPKQVTFAITNHCNMVCTTCSFPGVPKSERKHVSIDNAKYAIEFMKHNGVKMVSITGGEPLMHPQFLDICKLISDEDMMISYISTNGTLVTEDIAKELAKFNVNIIGLSIDVTNELGLGVTRKVNIKKTVVKAKKLLDKYLLDSYAGIVLGKHTKDIKNVLRTVRGLGFKKVIFSYPQVEMNSSYLAAKNSNELDCDVKFWNELINNILKEKRWNPYVDIFNTRVNLQEFNNFYSDHEYTFQCPAGREQFYLDWDLELFRCLNSNERYGNLHELNDLNFPYTSCSKCTQQTHRDYASFYHAYKTAKSLEEAMKRLDFRRFFRLLTLKTNRRALNSLIEGYLGGFA